MAPREGTRACFARSHASPWSRRRGCLRHQFPFLQPRISASSGEVICQRRPTFSVGREWLPARRRSPPKVSHAASRISSDKVGSLTARASVNAPTIPASVVIARLRLLAAVALLSRREIRSSCPRTDAVSALRTPSPWRTISPPKAAIAQPFARSARCRPDR